MARGYASSVINAPIDQVWTHIRDFDGLPSWHPGIASSEIEGGGPSDRVGCCRKLTLPDGGVLRERLLEMSDLGYHYSYEILESPLPLTNYRSTLRLRRISDGNRTYVEWASTFDPHPPEMKADAENLISNGVYQGGLDALKAHFGG